VIPVEKGVVNSSEHDVHSLAHSGFTFVEMADLNRWHRFAISCFERGEFEEAIHWLEKLVAASDQAPQYLNDLGVAQFKSGRLSDARVTLERAVARMPGYVAARNNLGMVLAAQGELQDAIKHLNAALEVVPDYVDARMNRAMAWLLAGDFERGWPEYEWRLLRRNPESEFEQPRWDGASLDGRTILLHAEQGRGDMFQFIRFAAPVQQLGARVLLRAPRSMLRVLETCAGIDRFVAVEDATTPAFDVQRSLLSLPMMLNVDLASIPNQVPYLEPDAARVEHWRARLGVGRDQGGRELLVGINWQGDPSYPLDQFRSIPLRHFARLAEIDGVRLVSLQKGYGEEQLPEFAARYDVTDLGAELDGEGHAFVDTAAVMQCLDLVVTSDTAIPHLAGALGRNVWVALSAVPDWRFMLDRLDSPWYPTMRLFRQRKVGQWEPVFEKIAGSLERFAGERG